MTGIDFNYNQAPTFLAACPRRAGVRQWQREFGDETNSMAYYIPRSR